MRWYIIEPIDTLFFKTAEPMEIGESHDAKFIFPPTSQTIIGAFRTLALVQNNISYNDYYNRNIKPEILEKIGTYDNSSPFEIIGPFFKSENRYFIPAPYCWYKYEEKVKKEEETKKDNDKRYFKIIFPNLINKNDFNFIKMQSEKLLWINKSNAESIGGKYFILVDDFININEKSMKNNKDKELLDKENFKVEAKFKNDFYEVEKRTGIALETNSRRARESHIYFFPHIRLKKNVQIVVGINCDLPIDPKGIIEIGAEKRKAYYEEINDFLNLWKKLNEIKSEHYMALSNIEGGENANDFLISTGKIQYTGGWDLKKNFHKPLKGYYTQGSIFSKKIDSSCIPILI